ncbi:hypothetical protein Syun_029732 [Stephania yunnanensis]|uniref:Uncharacterized protein n=1 Tax=Stephania yunnanensis TaxID=152371 RepID=A0AAP0EDR5_9MAGN
MAPENPNKMSKYTCVEDKSEKEIEEMFDMDGEKELYLDGEDEPKMGGEDEPDLERCATYLLFLHEIHELSVKKNVLTMPKGTVLPANPNILEDTDDLAKAGSVLLAMNPFKGAEVRGNELVSSCRKKPKDAVRGQDGLNLARALWPFIALNTAKFVIRFIKILQSHNKYQDLK